MHSIILDIETLDTSPTSIITEIGLIAFDRSTLLETACFACQPSLFEQLAAKRTASAETIRFHAANETLPNAIPDHDPASVLHSLCNFIKSHNPRRVWIQGPDFDRPILQDFCTQFGFQFPWDFWLTRDTRTLWDLAFPGVKHPKRAHHAVEDCRHTLLDMQSALSALKLNPEEVA